MDPIDATGYQPGGKVALLAVAGAAGALSRYGLGVANTTTVPIAIGFLGAFTTFSTFSYEVHTLLRNDRAGAALA